MIIKHILEHVQRYTSQGIHQYVGYNYNTLMIIFKKDTVNWEMLAVFSLEASL